MDPPEPSVDSIVSQPETEAAAAKPRGFRAWLKYAFAIEKNDESSLTSIDKTVLIRMAERIHARRLGPAAIFWLQSNRHMNFIGSQVMVAAEPVFDMAHPVLNGVLRYLGLNVPPDDYPLLIAAFEKRYSVEYLIQQLEARL